MIFNPKDTAEHISINSGICFTIGVGGALATGGISPLAAGVCCLLQPLAFKVSDIAIKNFFSASDSLTERQMQFIWGVTLLLPSLICWHQNLSVNPFAAIALQLSAIGAVCVARNIHLL